MGREGSQRRRIVAAEGPSASAPENDAPSLLPAALRRDQADQPLPSLFREHLATFLDGVHIHRGPSAPPEFLPAPELQPEEVARDHRDAMRRIHRALHRAGRPDLARSLNGNGEADVTDAGYTTDDPEGSLLPFLHAASIQDRIALGPDSGRPIPRLRDPAADLRPASQGLANPPSLIADAQGFSLHAASRIEAHDRDRLEGLIRYVARPRPGPPPNPRRRQGQVDSPPPLARRNPRLRLRSALQNGRGWSVSPPSSPIPASTPGPATTHGSLAPASTLRDRAVPPVPPTGSTTDCAQLSNRRTWADLLERTFAVDVLRCHHCGDRRRRIVVITDPLTCRKLLRYIGARYDPLLLAPARPPPQLTLHFA